VEPRVERLGEDQIERPGEALAGSPAIDGSILRTVGDPDIGDARAPERLAEGRPDPAAGDAVLDPEAADALVAMGQGPAVGRPGMGEVRRVEVQADPPAARPLDPAPEVFRPQLVALDLPPAGLGIAGVQVQPMRAGDER
jgi:hypothetical protein